VIEQNYTDFLFVKSVKIDILVKFILFTLGKQKLQKKKTTGKILIFVLPALNDLAGLTSSKVMV
jgi:hypothetical protein